MNAYLGDSSGSPLKGCSSAGQVTAYLWIKIYNNAASTRNAVILLVDVYVNNALQYSTYPNGLCVLDNIQPKATSSYAIYSFSWTCGQSVKLSRMTLSWETAKGTTCANANRKCANRGTKCYGGLTIDVPVKIPLSADFTSNSPQCCCDISFNDNSLGGVPPYTFQWNFGDGSSLSSQQNPIHTYNAPGTYSVALNVKDSAGASALIIKQVTLYSRPVVEAGNDLSITPGGSVFLGGRVSGGTPPYKFSWSPSSGLSNPSVPNTLASPTSTTTYTFTVTDSHGCISSDTMTLYVSSIKVTRSVSNSLVQLGSQVTYTYQVQNTGTSNLNMVTLIDSGFGNVVGPHTGDLNGDNLLNPGETWVYQAAGSVYVNTTNYATANAIDPTLTMVSSNSDIVMINVISSKDLPVCTIYGDNIICITTPSKYSYKITGTPVTKYQSTWLIDGSTAGDVNADGGITVNWMLYGGGNHLLQLTTNFIDDQGNIWRTSLCSIKVLAVDIPSAEIQVM